MIHLDTNALIRFFTKDDPMKAAKVKKLLEEKNEIFVSDVVFPELEYVLSHAYKLSRNNILKIYKFLISCSNIKINQSIKKAVMIFEQTNLDMADSIIAANSVGEHLATFDHELSKTEGVKNYWPAKSG